MWFFSSSLVQSSLQALRPIIWALEPETRARAFTFPGPFGINSKGLSEAGKRLGVGNNTPNFDISAVWNQKYTTSEILR